MTGCKAPARRTSLRIGGAESAIVLIR